MSQAKRALEARQEDDQPRLIVAQYPGECGHCNGPIRPKQMIGHSLDDRESDWMHSECIELNHAFWHAMDKDD